MEEVLNLTIAQSSILLEEHFKMKRRDSRDYMSTVRFAIWSESKDFSEVMDNEE